MRNHPRIESLWDMLERYGQLVANTVGALTTAEVLWRRPVVGTIAGSLDERAVTLDVKADVAAQAFQLVRQIIAMGGWEGLQSHLTRLEGKMSYAPHADVARGFRELQERIRDELSSEFFFHLSRSGAELYENPTPFGEAVSAKFGNAHADIRSAAQCFALGQGTACVFHLMRIMEYGVTTLARFLKVQIEVKRENWFDICNRASTAANNRPAKTRAQKARNARLGAAVAHLQTVRLAWRNEVMHPKQTYTLEEAREIYNAVRVFMGDLAELV